jgi:hypothetical protein
VIPPIWGGFAANFQQLRCGFCFPSEEAAVGANSGPVNRGERTIWQRAYPDIMMSQDLNAVSK